jgi:dUTP pyrophosphatase
MKIKLLSENAQLPKRATDNAAGYDLYVPANTVINPGRNIVPLNIAIAIPKGMEGQIRPRSGFSAKGIEGYPVNVAIAEAKRYDADVILGTIDSDYRGNVGVLIKSNEKTPFEIAKGTRIAQLVISTYYSDTLIVSDTLDDTERAQGGFGSTGTN